MMDTRHSEGRRAPCETGCYLPTGSPAPADGQASRLSRDISSRVTHHPTIGNVEGPASGPRVENDRIRERSRGERVAPVRAQ